MSRKSTWEALVDRSKALMTVDSAVADDLFFSEMDEGLREKKIGDKEALGELANHRKSFHAKYSTQLARQMADHVKENEEINTMDVGYTTPDGVKMSVGFARPHDGASEEEWGESFSHRQSLAYEESLVTDLRKELGLKFKASESEE